MRAACRRASCAELAGSAGGPKPGRGSFYGELARQHTNSFPLCFKLEAPHPSFDIG